MVTKRTSRGRKGRDDDDDDDEGRGRGRKSSGRGKGKSKGRGKKKSWRYKARSYEQTKKQSEQTGGMFDSPVRSDISTFSPRNEGEYTYRILPPSWEGNDHWGFQVHIHYGIGPDNQSYLCLDKMKGDTCPICEERREAEAQGQDEYAKELNSTKRWATWIIDRDNERDGPMIWLVPWSLDAEVAGLATDRRTQEVIQLDNPEEGFDVDFTRRGTGLRTKYQSVRIARSASPVSDDPDQQEEWQEIIEENPIPDCLMYYEYEYINRVFTGQATKQKDDDEEEAKPRSRRGREEEEEEEEPRKRRGKRREREEEEQEAEDDTSPLFPSEDDVLNADDVELGKIIEEYNLNLDTADFPSLRKARDAVLDEIETLQREADESGSEPQAEAQPEEDEKPARSRRGSSRKDREEEEEEKPARGRRGSKRGDDDDEDEKPGRRARSLGQTRRRLDDDE